MLSGSFNSHYETPDPIYNDMDKIFHFKIDLCANPRNHKHKNYFCDGHRDSLKQKWYKHSPCWMNPPYDNVGPFMQKAWAESQVGATIVCLVAVRTDTDWFHDYILDSAGARYLIVLKRRIRFWYNRDPKGAGPSPAFPSVIAIYSPDAIPSVLALTTIGGHQCRVLSLK